MVFGGSKRLGRKTSLDSLGWAKAVDSAQRRLCTKLSLRKFVPEKLGIGDKRQYSDFLSEEFTRVVEQGLRTHFPGTFSGGGRGTGAATASGIKSVDVAFNIEGLFLGLGVSVKTVGIPEDGYGFSHNYKRIGEEWSLETIRYHRYMPFSIIVGMLFLPEEACADRTQVTSLSGAVRHFKLLSGRTSATDFPELLEEIHVGIYSSTGAMAFFDVQQPLGNRELPESSTLRTFEELKDHLVESFKRRNPRLMVEGMP